MDTQGTNVPPELAAVLKALVDALGEKAKPADNEATSDPKDEQAAAHREFKEARAAQGKAYNEWTDKTNKIGDLRRQLEEANQAEAKLKQAVTEADDRLAKAQLKLQQLGETVKEATGSDDSSANARHGGRPPAGKRGQSELRKPAVVPELPETATPEEREAAAKVKQALDEYNKTAEEFHKVKARRRGDAPSPGPTDMDTTSAEEQAALALHGGQNINPMGLG